MERTALKNFRVNKNMTQEEFAEKMGVSRSCYQNIESGIRNGKLSFWLQLQAAFNIPTAAMWEIMQPQEAGENVEA